MKQIKIKQIENPVKDSIYMKQNMYSIYLGNNVTEYFSSNKAAKRFLAETNRFLNGKLHELNYIYSLLFAEYRRVWFYFNSNNEFKINVQLTDIDKRFNLCCTRSCSVNGNVNTIKNLISLGKQMNSLFDEIKSILVNKKYYADVQRVEIYIRQLQNLVTDLTEYSKKKPPISEG